MTTSKIKPFYQRTKFSFPIVTGIFLAFNDSLKLGLDSQTCTQLAILAVGYVASEAWVDLTLTAHS